MKDFFGRDLNIGDVVAFNAPVYKGLTRGVIEKFTPKGVRVSYEPSGKQFTESTAVSNKNVVKETK